jgi:BirA family biotin operon repressor/biotin-[acetyl-CoA-carboxylase] ligase
MKAHVRLPAGHRLVHFPEIDSTNAEALRHASQGEVGPVWYWADRQVQGRGRLGRSWESEIGNLYATLLVAREMRPAQAGSLSIVVALGVLKTFRAYLSPMSRLELKWPNDVLLDGKKVAGILVESSLQADLMFFAIGCGLNLLHAPRGTRYGATSLADNGVKVTPQAALETLSAEIDQVLRIWNKGAGFDALKPLWLQHAKGLGDLISVTAAGQTIAGYFEGLGENGSLLLRNRAGTQEFHAGEVSFADFSEGLP